MLPAWISGHYPLNHFVNNRAFRSTSVAAALSQQPLGFIDIGARGGVHDLVAPIAGLTAVLGFEPDEEACEEINRNARKSAMPWAQFRLLPVALADREGPATLHLCSAPTNHSLLPVNRDFAHRYRMDKFTQVGQVSLVTRTLDSVIFGQLEAESHWGEVIKLDTQGTEYEILQGAKRTLTERAVALFVEVEFCQIYAGQKFFSELECMLRDFGFSFYGFHSTHERSCKLLDKQRFLGRERLLHADAVFFKDPLPGSEPRPRLTRRGEFALFSCALLLGYFDFALELAEATFASDKQESSAVRNLIEELAYHNPGAASQAVAKLADVTSAHPDLANVAVGKFVDERRAVCNFEDTLVKLD